MAKTFAIITAVLLGISGFYLYTIKGELEELTSSKTTEEGTFAKRTKTVKKLNDDTDQLLEEGTSTSATADEREQDQKTKAAAYQTIQEETAKVEKNLKRVTKQLDDANKDLSGVIGLRELAPKIKSLNSDIAAAQGQLATSSALLSQKRAELAKTDAVLKKLTTLQQDKANFKTNPDLVTSVASVFPDLGYVILSSGDSSGVSANSKLNVVRGDEVVATLFVTSVEPNRAAASIDADSVAEGVTIKVGDVVKTAPVAELAEGA